MNLRTLMLACGLAPVMVPAQGASLRGRVLMDSTEQPIAGVVVAIDALRLQAMSDSLGNFLLAGIKPGAHIVTAKKIGFGALATRVRFAAKDALEADFLMSLSAQALPDVKVETKRALPPKMRDFEERMLAGTGGRFVTPEMLDKRAWSQTADIIRSNVPGLEIKRSGREMIVVGGRMQMPGGAMTNGGNMPGDCPAAIVLDGIFVYQGDASERPFDINSLAPGILAGIEYYASAASMPARYNGTRNTCGLMILWTK